MSTTMMSDSMAMPARLVTDTPEVEFVECDCCGLTEECTPEYIKRIRDRYLGKWICGLCAEAVKDEIVRSNRLIGADEAMARHVSFCRSPISSGSSPDPTVHLIATVRQILRRSLDSLASVKSLPCNPTRKSSDGAGIA